MSRRVGAIEVPFFNTYLYEGGDAYAVDFYYWPTAPDYAEQFREGWTQIARHAPARPRSTLLYFTRCEECGFEILTNRDAGSSLRCRSCETRFIVAPHHTPELEALVDAVHGRLGKTVESVAGHRLVVLLQPLDPEGATDVARACEELGFAPVEREHPVAVNLWDEGTRRGILENELAYTVWAKVTPPGATAYAGETAPEVEELLRAVGAVTELRSLSMSYDPEDDTLFGRVIRGDAAGVEESARDALAENPEDEFALEALVEALVLEGKLDEAAQNALAATELQPSNADRWKTLGRIELDRGRASEAVDALTRAIDLDPVNRMALFFLAHAYAELGQDGKAADVYARLAAVGGPPI